MMRMSWPGFFSLGQKPNAFIMAQTVKNFFKDRFAELNNVSWPTQRQAVHAMILVLTIMLIVGVFLGFVDYGLNQVVLTLLG